jgi:hypothetical protein
MYMKGPAVTVALNSAHVISVHLRKDIKTERIGVAIGEK